MSVRVITAVVFFFATMICAESARATSCSNESLVGAYGFSFGWPQALYFGNQGVFVGQMTANGKGSLTVSGTGTGVLTSGSFKGKYSVAANCRGSFTFDENSSTAHFLFVLDEGNKGFQMIRTDSDWETPGFGMAQVATTCGLTGTKQNLAINVVGTIPGSSINKAIVGQLQLDGKGHITGGEILMSVNFSNSTVSVTGKYTEETNCTGTLQITPKGSATLNFNTISVNAGTELLLIETDSGTVIAGTALR